MVKITWLRPRLNYHSHELGLVCVSEDDRGNISMSGLGDGREAGQPDSIEFDGLGECSARHPSDVTENEVTMYDDVINHWRETSLVCDVNLTEVIPPSDIEVRVSDT